MAENKLKQIEVDIPKGNALYDCKSVRIRCVRITTPDFMMNETVFFL